MIDYSEQTCIACNKIFTEQDDIVVCPECGTPYHRDCYHAVGHCINDALHQSGGSWQVEMHHQQEEEKKALHQAEMEQQAAQRARDGMTDVSKAPMYDGFRMNNDPCLGLDPNEQMDGVTVKEMTSFIATNRFYYLPIFRMMKITGKKISFNLTCLFFPQFYFANRKMWAMTLLSILLQFVIAVPSSLLVISEQMGIAFDWLNTQSTVFHMIVNVTSIVDLAFSMICCLFGNYFYYRFALKKIKSVKKEPTPPEQLYVNLTEAGGTSVGNIVLAAVIQLALVFTFSLALFLL